MLKNIIFDVDGVIRSLNDSKLEDILNKDEYEICSKKFKDFTVKQFFKHCFKHNDFYYDYDKGLVGEDEFITYFAKREGLPKDIFAKIVEYKYVHHTFYKETLDFVKKLNNEGYNTYILSNMGKRLCEVVKSNINSSVLFDDVVFSCEAHHAKPFLDMYEFAIDKWKINPSESIFIDDRQENLEPFKSLGGHIFLFDDKNLQQSITNLYDYIKSVK